MQLTRSVPIAAGLALSLLWAGAPALAQQQPERETAVRADDRPAPLKVIVRAECTIYTEPSDSAGVRRQASPMEFFYVMPNPDGSDNYRIDETDDGWWYRIHTREQTVQGFQYGFIHSSNVTEWWHREAVGFLPRSNHRQRVRFYTSSDEWQQGFSTYPDPPDADEVALAIEPEPQHAEADLQDTGKNNGRENQRRVAAKRRIEAGEDDDHRAGRAGDLRAGAAEQGSEETNENGTPEAGDGAGA